MRVARPDSLRSQRSSLPPRIGPTPTVQPVLLPRKRYMGVSDAG